jgi:antitoxin component YwqK of YwqJK toxin-antitoxin module
MKSKFSIFVSLLSLMFLSSESQILKKTFYDYRKTKPDEVYYVNNNGQYNGLYIRYNEFGAKAVEANFKNGVKQGAAKEYYIRGGKSKLKISGNYKNDEKDGLWTTYTYVKNGESYFLLMQSWGSGSIEDDVFNTGVQTKFMEEQFENGIIKKEIQYHPNGKVFQIKHFNEYKRIVGEYICYNKAGQVVTKGLIGPNGEMNGEWIIPREESGISPNDKESLGSIAYTQKLRFNKEGDLDTNYVSRSYYLSGRIKDSVKVISIDGKSGYRYDGRWYLCGKSLLLSGPYKSFYENGKLQEEGNYLVINGKSVKTGVWKLYNKEGVLSNEKYFNEMGEENNSRTE